MSATHGPLGGHRHDHLFPRRPNRVFEPPKSWRDRVFDAAGNCLDFGCPCSVDEPWRHDEEESDE